MGQSEQLVERAYVRPYTPYVHPRPQVVNMVVLVIMINPIHPNNCYGMMTRCFHPECFVCRSLPCGASTSLNQEPLSTS